MTVNEKSKFISATTFGPFYRGGKETECFAVQSGQSFEDMLQFAQSYIYHTLELTNIFTDDSDASKKNYFPILEAMLQPAAALLKAISREEITSPVSVARLSLNVDILSDLERASMVLDQGQYMADAIADHPSGEGIAGLAEFIVSAQNIIDSVRTRIREESFTGPTDHT